MLECVAKFTNNFHYRRSAILEAIHVQPWINTSAVVKKENGTQRKTKVSPWCTHYSYYRCRKAPLGPKQCQQYNKTPSQKIALLFTFTLVHLKLQINVILEYINGALYFNVWASVIQIMRSLCSGSTVICFPTL